MTVKASEAVATILIAINEVWGYIFGKWGQEWPTANVYPLADWHMGRNRSVAVPPPADNSPDNES